uniref:Monocarboxylate transporter 12-like n=1 Tax=Saccoglossus kowalevskii TaxID=10224 RepID=A0ABM0MBR3_SACKO|nr:PREDICTED: monocarboxylate transporter 12-like [Saccoglossus kowalevskii]
MKLVSKEDGGCYGWIIVLACHCVEAVMFGIQVGMGVFMVEFMEYFGEGAGRTALIQSIMIGCKTFPAPLISSLKNKFGTRPLVIIGGVLSSGGILLSSFANSVNVLLFSYSVIVGIGYGLIYGPSILLVGQYFHKRHALANGIAQSGVAVGVMTFPPLYQILIDKYGWRGTMLVMAGINMNMVVCGILMRPPPKYDPEPIDETSENIMQQYSTVDSGEGSYRTMETFGRDALEETNNVWFFSPMFITSCAWLLAGVSLMSILVANSNYLVLAFIAAIYGISSGTAIPLHGAVCMKACFGKEDMSSAFGWFLTYISIGAICGPPTAAPLVSSLNKKFGTRVVVVTGGIISSIGLLLSSFANSVYVLYVSYGIIGGFGIGLAYGPSIVIVGQYFNKRHALANGLVYAGVGIGLIIFPPIYQLLINKYGWRGAILVISAINMNIVVCGVLLREPRMKTNPQIRVKKMEFNEKKKQQNEIYSPEQPYIIKLRQKNDEINSRCQNEIGAGEAEGETLL